MTKAGGFDVVIGNPPYVRQESLKDQKEYYQSRYAVYQGTADLYAYFIEKGISLLRPGGVFVLADIDIVILRRRNGGGVPSNPGQSGKGQRLVAMLFVDAEKTQR